MNYYTSITVLCWIALGILCILVRENGRLPREDKRRFYLSYILIALAALSEWLGVRLSGDMAHPIWMLRTVKCIDYILTPLAGGSIIAQLSGRSVWKKLMGGVLVANTVLQLVTTFTGGMLNFDSQHHYTTGPLHSLYLAVCILVVLLTVMEFNSYGYRFRRQNKVSLYAVLLLVVAGIAMQELQSTGVRTVYLALTLGMALLFIHYTEFAQMEADDHLQEQHTKITTDSLTGVHSRYAYSQALKKLDEAQALPEGFVVFSIDINGLKTANDTLGHEAGDEIICAAARCIQEAMGPWGDCYRTGGDEFVVLGAMQGDRTAEALDRLARAAESWKGEKAESLHLAAGCARAADHPGLSAEKLVGAADRAMYAQKAAYYRQAGIDRRRR